MDIYVCDVTQRPSLAIVQVLQTCFGIKSSRNFEVPVFTNPQTSADCRECLANMAAHHWIEAPQLLSCILLPFDIFVPPNSLLHILAPD
jgi:hypothetical protein